MLAASKGDSVEARTERRQRMASIRSRRQRGQLRGSFGESLGWGTRMTGLRPVLCLRCAFWGELVGLLPATRSERVAVPWSRLEMLA